MKNTHKNRQNFRFLLGENIHNVLIRNVLMYVFRILFNNDSQQITFNSAEKMAKKMVQKHDFWLKIHILCIYIMYSFW